MVGREFWRDEEHLLALADRPTCQEVGDIPQSKLRRERDESGSIVEEFAACPGLSGDGKKIAAPKGDAEPFVDIPLALLSFFIREAILLKESLASEGAELNADHLVALVTEPEEIL